tara:strand:+ start:1438 stop:1881 length:444 start_codon:yes stop_codon:yes gene_type:complete
MLNKCSFIGNLGRDPEIRLTQSGSKVGNFTIACSEKWKDKQTGETKEKTEWVRIVVFSDGLCGVIERYLKKGSKVYIEGKMQTRKWQGNDGVEKYTTEIVLQGFDAKMIMLDGKSEGGGNYGGQEQRQEAGSGSPESAPDLDDEIPF